MAQPDRLSLGLGSALSAVLLTKGSPCTLSLPCHARRQWEAAMRPETLLELLQPAQRTTACSSGPLSFRYVFHTEWASSRPGEVSGQPEKHGIDFVAAQAFWSDPDPLEIPAQSFDEPRTQVIGRIRDLVWSASVTHRGERSRIISVRRARDEKSSVPDLAEALGLQGDAAINPEPHSGSIRGALLDGAAREGLGQRLQQLLK